jgi:hypothetical protein
MLSNLILLHLKVCKRIAAKEKTFIAARKVFGIKTPG